MHTLFFSDGKVPKRLLTARTSNCMQGEQSFSGVRFRHSYFLGIMYKLLTLRVKRTHRK